MLGHPSEIQPARGWKVFEAPGVQPLFPEKDQAIDWGDAFLGANRLLVRLNHVASFIVNANHSIM